MRTRFVRKFRTKLIFTCYGPEKGKEVPGGTIKNLPEETVEELREAESKTKKLLEIAGIKGKKKKSKGE